MALRKIVTEGDSVLHKRCRPVTNCDARLGEHIDDMRATPTAADGDDVLTCMNGSRSESPIIDRSTARLKPKKVSRQSRSLYSR